MILEKRKECGVRSPFTQLFSEVTVCAVGDWGGLGVGGVGEGLDLKQKEANIPG